MKIDPAAPNTLEWLLARAGVVTASEFTQFLTSNFELRNGEMLHTYRARKLAERWLGSPIAGSQSLDMEFGHILEEQALPAFELLTGKKVTRVGLITTDDGRLGCSPDGLLGEDAGIEIKCPRVETHVKYLLRDKVPTEYLAQVHGALYVTGRPRWIFMSYCRRLPELIITVERDEEIQEKLQESLTEFIELLDNSWNRLCEINGGPPRPSSQTAKEKQEFTPTTTDVMT